MGRVLFGSLIVALAAAVGFAAYWFLVRGENGGESAEAALTRLSKQSAQTTYYTRYESEDVNGANSLTPLTFYNKPGALFRVDFPEPIHAKEGKNILDSTAILAHNVRVGESHEATNHPH